MRRAIVEFNYSIQSLIQDRGTYTYLKDTIHVQENMLSDMLRYDIINIVSAMDRFFHEIVRIGILKAYQNPTIMTAQCKKFSLKMSTVKEIERTRGIPIPSCPEDSFEYWINLELIERLRVLSFQQCSKLKEAMSYIWDENQKFSTIAQHMTYHLIGSTINDKQKYLEEKIDLLIDRRNQIAHQADVDLSTNTKQNITKAWVDDSVNLIKDFVYTAYSLITGDTTFAKI